MCALFLLLNIPLGLHAQEGQQRYTVKNGKMYIEMDRLTRETALDSFIARFNLYDLALKQFVKTSNPDSLQKLGWKIEINNESGFIISKPLMPFENINDPADKIIFTEKHPTFAEMFPAVNNGITYGYNRFRRKAPFGTLDSVVRFFLRSHADAREVVLAGSFNDWSPTRLHMIKTDSGWIAPVKLGPGKYWYKFVVDGHWMTDNDNLLNENDGQGNVNSVFYKPNTVFRLDGFGNAKKVFLAGSFNRWEPKNLPMTRTATGWELPVYLAEGTHTYKFVVDGTWMADEKNSVKLPDGVQGFNSVITVGTPYVFRLRGYEGARQVILAGSFNNWREFELVMNPVSGGWELPYVIGPGNYEYRFIVDGKWVSDPVNSFTSTGSGNSFLIIAPNYSFRLKGHEGARKVFLAGDFNDWSPTAFPMKKEGDEWVFSVHLNAGKVRYKFIVDGQWITDPSNKLWEQNEHGTGNSIIWIDR